MKTHKSQALWWDSVNKILYAELPNRFIAKIYETYLINKYSPKNNLSEKLGHDISLMQFDENQISWKQLKKSELIRPKSISISKKNVNNPDHFSVLVDFSFLDFLFANIHNLLTVYSCLKYRQLAFVFNLADDSVLKKNLTLVHSRLIPFSTVNYLSFAQGDRSKQEVFLNVYNPSNLGNNSLFLNEVLQRINAAIAFRFSLPVKHYVTPYNKN